MQKASVHTSWICCSCDSICKRSIAATIISIPINMSEQRRAEGYQLCEPLVPSDTSQSISVYYSRQSETYKSILPKVIILKLPKRENKIWLWLRIYSKYSALIPSKNGNWYWSPPSPQGLQLGQSLISCLLVLIVVLRRSSRWIGTSSSLV